MLTDKDSWRRAKRRVVALLLLIGAIAPSTAEAVTYNWTGAAGSNQWAGSLGPVLNWSPNSLPTATASVVFASPTPFNNVNLQSARAVGDVTFGGAQGYSLNGGLLYVGSGAITTNADAVATTHRIDTPLTLGAAGVFSVAGQTTLDVRRGVTDVNGSTTGGFGLAKTGAGVLNLGASDVVVDSLLAFEGTLNIEGAQVTTRKPNDFGYDFQTATNVSGGATLTSQAGSFVRVTGAGAPLLSLRGAGTEMTGSVYVLAGFGGSAGQIKISDRARVSTGIFIVGIESAALGSTATIDSRGLLDTSILSLGGDAGALATMTVSDAGTMVNAERVLLGGFQEDVTGGTTTLTVDRDARLTATGTTSFFTSTSTLVVDKGFYVTPRLGTYVGSTPLIQLSNASAGQAALTINNSDVNTTETYAGTITDAAHGPGGVLKIGAGKQILAGQSSYTGGTTINAGTLQTGRGDALPTTGPVTLGGGVLDLGGHTQHIGALTLTSGSVAGAAGSSLVASGATLRSGTIGAPLYAPGGAITKLGTGTVTGTAPINAATVTVAEGVLDSQAGITGSVALSGTAQLKLRGVFSGSLTSATDTRTTLTGATILAGPIEAEGRLEVNSQSLILDADVSPLVRTTTIGGGLISSSKTFRVGESLSGSGTVAAGLSVGGDETLQPTITASGGSLTLGARNYPDSLTYYGGRLVAGANALNLVSAGYTTLGSSATVAGGSINSINGVYVRQNATLSGYGVVSGPLDNRGTVTGSGGELRLTGNVTGGGGFAGNVTFEGSYSPGNFGTANAAFAGPATFAATNHLLIELGGATPGAGHDKISAASTLALGGSLEVSLIRDFELSVGDAFDLFDFGAEGLSGAFSSIALPPLASGLQWNASQLYTTGVLSVGLQGDYNGDGAVDAADYTVYRDTLHTTGAALPADGNGDGVIDTADYALWQTNYGRQANALASVGQVPEATTIAMASVAALALWRRAAR